MQATPEPKDQFSALLSDVVQRTIESSDLSLPLADLGIDSLDMALIVGMFHDHGARLVEDLVSAWETGLDVKYYFETLVAQADTEADRV